MSWDIFSKSKIQYFLQKLKDKFVQKETGKGLSTNDFTNEDKALIGQTLGNNAILQTDKIPFLTRQTLNPTGFSGYVREKLIGASYAWNNVCSAYNNYALSSTASTQEGQLYYRNLGSVSSEIIAGHKYFVRIENKNASSNFSSFRVYLMESSGYKTILANKNSVATGLVSVSNASQQIARFYATDTNTCTANLYVSVTDLTLAFGSTIADYLYSLTNNGGITKLRDMGFPIDKYTPYGYGLYSVKTSGKKIVGKNLFDNTKITKNTRVNASGTTAYQGCDCSDFIPVKPNTAYFFTNMQPSTIMHGVYFYNKAKEYLRSTALNTLGTVSVSTSDGEYYVRLNIPDTNLNTAQMEEGSTPTTYEPYSSTTYPLGNDELRGKFDLVNGEIVASGDVKESNGEITRVRGSVHLGDVTFSYNSTYGIFSYTLPNGKTWAINTMPTLLIGTGRFELVGARALAGFADKQYSIVAATASVGFKDSGYTDPTLFKNSLNGVYLEYELATPTTEQSTPFADPMSLVGATTEEYIDTRDVPCPVGAERQYMGQSEDIVEIPSSPLSDGERYLKSIVSGGKQQLVWESPYGLLKSKTYTLTPNSNGRIQLGVIDDMIPLHIICETRGIYAILRKSAGTNYYYARCTTDTGEVYTTQAETFTVYGLPIK